MAKPGRKPKPHGMKVLEGKFPKGGQKSGGKKVALGDVGDPPKYFTAEARKIWEYLKAVLKRYGIIGELDTYALENVCLAIVFRRKAVRELLRGGIVRADKAHGGRRAKSPAWQVYRNAQAGERQWLEQLGLTPAARERLKIEPPGEVDDMEKLLGEEAKA